MSGFSGGGSFSSLLSVVEPEKFDGFAMLCGDLYGGYDVQWGVTDMPMLEYGLATAEANE